MPGVSAFLCDFVLTNNLLVSTMYNIIATLNFRCLSMCMCARVCNAPFPCTVRSRSVILLLSVMCSFQVFATWILLMPATKRINQNCKCFRSMVKMVFGYSHGVFSRCPCHFLYTHFTHLHFSSSNLSISFSLSLPFPILLCHFAPNWLRIFQLI